MARLGRAQPFKPLIQRPLAMKTQAIILTETITLVDGLSRSISKAFSEVITLVESFSKMKITTIILTETISLVASLLSLATAKPIVGLIVGLVKRTKTIFGTHNEGGPQIGKVARTGTIFGRSKKE